MKRPSAFPKSHLLLLLCVVLLESPANSQLIPTVRTVPWTPGTHVGVPGGIPSNRTNLINVTSAPYNADRSGASNTRDAIQAAIQAATSGQVVYLPPGTYRIDGALYFDQGRDGITLRGAGPSTIIDCRTANVAVNVGTASDYNWSWPPNGNGNYITAGLTQGSTSITIANTSFFSVGQMIQIALENDTTAAQPVVHVTGYPYLRRQMTRLTGKTATSLTFWPPIYETVGGSSNVVHVAQFQTDSVGIEDLVIDCSNGSAQVGVQFEQAFGCWIKGVRVINTANYGFFLWDSLNCEVRQCYGDRRKTEGSNGAGLLFNTSFACLIEDNIFYKNFPIIEVNQGAAGNVFAYNFCWDSSVFGVQGAGIDSNHGPHNRFNLYEGNVAPNLQSDGYFGSASRDTLFRNWFHGSSPTTTGGWLITLNRFTRDYSIVGNLLGTTGNNGAYSFGNPNMGNGGSSGTAQPSLGDWWADWRTTPGPGGYQELDLDVQATTLLKGNYLFGIGIPSGEALGGQTLPLSLFRASKPAWWADSLTWPPFDPTSVSGSQFTSGSITSVFHVPAQQAFFNNGVWPSGGSGGGGGSKPAPAGNLRLSSN